MPDFSILFRDLGVGPTILGILFIALIIIAFMKGGKGSGSGSGKGTSNKTGTTPPPSTPSTGA